MMKLRSRRGTSRLLRGMIHASAYLAVMALMACSADLPLVPNEPSVALILFAGDGQTGSVGETLPAPLVVKAVDASGVPVSGVQVRWRVTRGEGAVTPAHTTTDAAGVAEVTWTLGTAVGLNSARAAAVGALPVIINATAVPGPVALVTMSSDSVIVDLGRTAQLVAEAWDEYGNAATGDPLAWSSADSAVVTVDEAGVITPVAKGSTTVTAASADGPSASASIVVPDAPLRYLAALRGIEIGSAVLHMPLDTDAVYTLTLDREFNTVTPEQVMKFQWLRPSRSTFDFSLADRFMEFAEASGMVVHGHTLVWHHNLPNWLTTGGFNRSEVLEILKDHILTVVGRYRGRIESWDVVNEAIDPDGVSLRNSFWLQSIGPEYIDSAFTWAAEADSQVRLYYNDYSGEGLNTRSNTIFDLVSGLVGRGVPIHGVGLESHFELGNAPPQQNIIDNMNRIAGIGLDVRVSELDVRIQGTPSAADLESQASTFRSMLQACLPVTRCKAVTMWGFTDKYSWIPWAHPGWGSATILDEEFDPKPAYHALFDELSSPGP